jgi:hypothetical protein
LSRFGFQVHTRLLTHKWHELLVLTTSAYQAIHGHHKLTSTSTDGTEAHFTQEVNIIKVFGNLLFHYKFSSVNGFFKLN